MRIHPPLRPYDGSLAYIMHADLAHKADICAKVLAQAHKLFHGGQLEASVGPLLLRAADLLDDIDELVLPLHPIRNVEEFALAARLHRDLESAQAAIAAFRREALHAAKPNGKR